MALQLTAEARKALPLLRVLTLGDGNFSFSAAISTAHDGKRVRSSKNAAATSASAAPAATAPDSDAAAAAAPSTSTSTSTAPPAAAATPSFVPAQRLQLVATSFDSGAALHSKYPEAQKLVDKIVGAKRAAVQQRTVLHDVDATNLERTLLPQMAAGQDGDSSSGGAAPSASGSGAADPIAVPPSLQFDVIIFNHPHSGMEDLAVHSSLLAHFFHSANFFLRQSTASAPASAGAGIAQPQPQVHVTLCQRQPEEWQLLQHAWAKGFELVSRSEFLEAHYPGYETKRHHVNKTFAKRSVQRMELFIFQRRDLAAHSAVEGARRRPEEPLYTRAEQDPHFAHNLMSRVIPMPPFKPTLPYEQAIAAINAAAAAAATGDPAAAGTAAAASSAAAPSAAPSLRTDITCDVCHKGFSSERGLHYHKENVHNRGASATDAAPPGDAALALVCHQCDPPRTFKEQAALTQHVLARHTPGSGAATAAATVPAQSAASQPTDDARPSAETDAAQQLPCPICPLRFASAELLEAHLSGVKPVAAAQLECATCGRLFSNQRALVQHERAASLAPEKHVRIVIADTAGLASTSVSEGAGVGAGGQARSKMKRLRGMAANPENKQSVVQRLQVKKVDSGAVSASASSDGADAAAPAVSSSSAAAAAAPDSGASASVAAQLIAPPCDPFPGLEEELEGSARDLVGCTSQVRVVRAADLRVRGSMPHTLQAAFIARLLEPPAAADGDGDEEQQRKLDAAPRDVCVGVCLPAGYALLEAQGTPLQPDAASNSTPVEVTFVSPLLIRDALHTLLMAASPVYAAWKADELNRKLMELFQQQAGGGDDDDE